MSCARLICVNDRKFCGWLCFAMATNKNRPMPPLRDRVDLREVLSFHLLASQRRDVILDEANSLEAAGKIPEARHRLKQAEEIDALIKTLEDNCGSPWS